MRIPLDKVLRHAEQRLSFRPDAGFTERLSLYKKFFKIEQHRLRNLHRAGGGGREIAEGRAQLVDVLLHHIFKESETRARHFHPHEALPLSLIAVGGYGRGELAPFSDIDVVFLHDDVAAPSRPVGEATPVPETGGKYVAAVVTQVLYLLWDIGFEIGHATRTIADCVAHASRDLKSKTALLEARLVSGDQGIFERCRQELISACFSREPAAYVASRLADQRERHAKQGDTVFLQEPNIKNGCGGLRDVHDMLWMSAVWHGASTLEQMRQRQLLTLSDYKSVERAYDFLLRVRNELHYQTNRATDVLSLALQPRLATALNYPQADPLRRTEAFMRDYYLHARNIYLITSAANRRLEERLLAPATVFTMPGQSPAGAQRLDGFVLKNGCLEVASEGAFQRDPLQLMRAFFHAQQRNADLGPGLRRLIRERLAVVNSNFRRDASAADIFLTILKQKGCVGRVLRLMHETGFLGKYLPEFGRLTCLVQHEFYHRYTADEHTLVAIETLDRVIDAAEPPFVAYKKIFQQLENPHLLYLALLLHDTGRGAATARHAEAGAALAARVAARLRLTPDATATLLLLVRHHLSMSQLSQRRDLDDHHTIVEMGRLAQSETGLDMLYLLTFADGQALGGGVWTEWKEALLRELFEKTRALLRGEPARHALARRIEALRAEVRSLVGSSLPADEVNAHLDLMPNGYFLRTPASEIIDHLRIVHRFLQQLEQADGIETLNPVIEWQHFPNQGYSRATMCTWDRLGLFARIAGSFAVAGLNILNARIYTRADQIVLDAFDVCDTHLGAATNPRSIRVMEETLARACTGNTVDFEALLEAKSATGLLVVPQHGAIPTIIEFDNEASEDRTVIEVQAEDRIGLLYAICRALTSIGLNITFAKISTEKGAAIDAFYVEAPGSGKITDDREIERIREALLAAVKAASQRREP